MAQSAFRGTSIFLAILMLAAIPLPATADVVIRSEVVDLFPSGTLDNSSDWVLSSQYGYTPEVSAHWTDVMVTDSHLSFTHERPQNVDQDTSWALYSPTDSNLSLGFPDGGYSWSKGPEIELTNFDMSGHTNDPLMNVSLMVAFAIPDTLQDDEVRITVEWDGNIELVKNFAHTQQAIDNMQGNPLEISLDSVNTWSWSQLEDLLVTVDYVSVGGIDDSEVRVDAIGINYVFQSQWSGFDSGKAFHTTPMEMYPFHDFELSSGEQNDLVTTSCGLEIVGGSSSGGWLTSSLQLPHDQTWGRLHFFGNASVDVEVQTSTDGQSWGSGVGVTDGVIISGANYVRVDVVIFDGCLSGLRIDFNDPTLSVSGEITGDTAGLVNNYSYLNIAIGTNLITSLPISPGAFSLSLPVGRYLPSIGDDFEVGIGTRFYWSSNGEPETVVAQIEDMTLTGGFVVEWDYDPICQRPADVYLDEDENGKIVTLRDSCSDDITPVDDLVVTATSQDESIVKVTVDDGRLVFNQQSEMSGLVPIDIAVTDQRGNQWQTIIDVLVSPVDDPPTYDNIPQEVLAPVGEPVTIVLNVQDIDTDLSSVSVVTDFSWATIDEFGNLNLAPLSPGTFDLSISFSDGTTTLTEYVTVLATSDPDLVIEQVLFEASEMKVGSVAEITVWVRNEGLSAASLVSIRCYNNQTLIDSANITYIDVDGLGEATCYWPLPMQEGSTSLRVYVDPTHDILEVSETNNEYSSLVNILPADDNTDDGGSSEGNSEPLFASSTIWIIAAILIFGGIIAMQLGPGRVRRNF